MEKYPHKRNPFMQERVINDYFYHLLNKYFMLFAQRVHQQGNIEPNQQDPFPEDRLSEM